MKISLLLTMVALSATLSAFGQEVPKPKFVDPANMNLMVKPGEDFVNCASDIKPGDKLYKKPEDRINIW